MFPTGDPECDDSSEFFANLMDAGADHTYVYDLDDGTQMCGSCSVPSMTYDECEAIIPFSASETSNYEQDWGCTYWSDEDCPECGSSDECAAEAGCHSFCCDTYGQCCGDASGDYDGWDDGDECTVLGPVARDLCEWHDIDGMGSDDAGLENCRTWCSDEPSCFAIQWVEGEGWCNSCTGWDNDQGVDSLSSWAATMGDATVQSRGCWDGGSEAGSSAGSCYSSTTHAVSCDVEEAACSVDDMEYWYAPGYVSTHTGCCHCEASCDHDAETSDVECTYYD